MLSLASAVEGFNNLLALDRPTSIINLLKLARYFSLHWSETKILGRARHCQFFWKKFVMFV